jgi:hypothetical protein
MSHPYYHSLSSVKKFGGVVEDYLPIHNFFDESKQYLGDFRHRALRHHAQGIFECEKVFGTTITNTDGKVIPVRLIGEQHVIEDCSRIPTLEDWFKNIKPEAWMNSPRKLSKEIEERDEKAVVTILKGTTEDGTEYIKTIRSIKDENS